MTRGAIVALLMLVPGCGDGASAPQASRDIASIDTTNAASPPQQPVRQIGAVSGLKGLASPLQGAVSDFAVERTDFGTRVQIAADTLFAFDQAAIAPAAEANLQRTAELVRQGGRGTITVIGHTDSKGEEKYNLDLSRQRADAVAAWLRGQPGMDSRIFASEGHGETEPIAPNTAADGTDNPQGRARNRRVTVDIPK